MIRIVSDGLSSKSLRVIDAETGLELKGIMKVEILIEPGEVNKAVLTVALGSMDLQADEGYVSGHQADVYVGARLEELPAVFSVACTPEPEVSPAEDLAAVFSLESQGVTLHVLDEVSEFPPSRSWTPGHEPWATLRRRLDDIDRSLSGMQANAGKDAGTCTPAGLAVDGGYKGLRG